MPSPKEEPGLSRFDDPEKEYGIRYLANSLQGCLIELLARFRLNPDAEERLEAVEGVDLDEEKPELTREQGLADWLAKPQRIGSCHLTEPTHLVDVNDGALLASLNLRPRIRLALSEAGETELDESTIRKRGEAGRRITQAVSRVLYEMEPRPGGLAYKSRLADEEQCWALYGETPVRFEPNMPELSVRNPVHVRLVRETAKRFVVALPPDWREE